MRLRRDNSPQLLRCEYDLNLDDNYNASGCELFWAAKAINKFVFEPFLQIGDLRFG